MLSAQALRRTLLYCTIIDFAILIAWWVIIMLPHKWLLNLTGDIFENDRKSFDFLVFFLLMAFKLAIIMFNLVPCIALYLARDREPGAAAGV